MKNILDTLTEKLSAQAKSGVGIKGIQKEDIEELIRANISAHESLEEVSEGMSDKEVKDWIKDSVSITLKQSKSPIKNILLDFGSELTGKAVVFERERPLSSLIEANREYAKLLGNIAKNLDKIMEDGFVEIYNSRLSTISLLGLIADSDTLINFTMYLYTFLVRASVGDYDSIPKYRTVYLLDNYSAAASIVNNMCNHKGRFEFLSNVNRLQQKGLDLVVSKDGEFGVNEQVTAGFIGEGLLITIGSALSKINIFDAVGKWIDDYKFSKYNRNKEIREWIRTHVSLLKIQLAEAEPSSREYTKLFNIIRAYDTMIAEYDEKIADYEGEG